MMLDIKNLSISYGRKNIIDDISFTAEKGRITTIIGKNGSGKSSIVSCVNRMIPYDGTICIDGTDIAMLKPKERAKQIAILPQTLPVPDVSVEELVSFGRSPYLGVSGRLSEYDNSIVDKYMAFTGADEIRHRRVNTLSGGERQKAYLAMILSQETPFIIFDEPTTHMDMQYESSFIDMIMSLRGKKTILMIMHDLTQAVRISDRLIVIDNRTVCYNGDASDCAEKGIIEHAFGVKQHKFTENGKEYRFFANF